MGSINVNFFEKMIEAKRLEQEALMMLLPEKMQKHVSVISRELKAMLMESIIDLAERVADEVGETVSEGEEINQKKDPKQQKDPRQKKDPNDASMGATTHSKVKKIDIG